MIGKALQYALDNELIRTQGDRPSVPNVIVTMTDGLSQVYIAFRTMLNSEPKVQLTCNPYGVIFHFT